MKILLLTQWFDPEPSFKGLAFARELARRGDTVEILTGFPNYPGGKVYPGYRIRPWQVESVEGFRVCRVALYPSHDRSALRRSINYVSFALASAILGPFLVHRPDVIYVYHPPGTIGIPALFLRWWFSAPIVYDVQDLWPDTIAATGMVSHPVLLSWIDRFCRWVYRRADQIVVLSPGFREVLRARGIPEERIRIVYNWAPDQVLASNPAPRRSRGQDQEFRVVFAGAMGAAQALDAVLDAAAICSVSAPQVRFLLVGGGTERDRLEQRARSLRLSNVSFVSWQPLEAMRPVFEQADALLVHLKDDPLFRITIPSKTQAYLAAGRPIVMAVRGDAADLVARAGAGILARPEDPDSIAAAIGNLAALSPAEREQMGRNGRAFYDKELAIGVAVESFRDVFRHVCARHSAWNRDSARVPS
jgi:glycosyltransferase involved in cell wall biosynthesis